MQSTHDRREIAADYLVIEFNESSRQAFWYDYADHFRTGAFINRNGSFLPVVDTREKIAVHVCGLHFGDQLTVTTNPLAVPEGGADIRGGMLASTPTTNLAASLDAIQNPSATGNASTGGSLGYSSTPAVTTTVVNGIAQGKISGRGTDSKPTYVDGTVSASGQQIALMMYATYMNAKALIQSIHDFELKTKQDAFEHQVANLGDHCPQRFVIPGSLDAIQQEMCVLFDQEVKYQRKDLEDAAAFDEDVNSAQLLSSDLGTLGVSLAAQTFGARAVAIQNNFATLKGVLGLSGYDDWKRDPDHSKSAYPGCTEQSKNPLTPAGRRPRPRNGKAKSKPVATPDPNAPIPAAEVNCERAEQEEFNGFNRDYQKELQTLTSAIDNGTFPNIPRPAQPFSSDDIDKWNPTDMFNEVNALQADLRAIDQKAATTFNALNEWYRESRLEQTDLLAPATSNTVMRVSIIVQRGYTPFTLASSPTPIAPSSAAPAPAAPAAAAAASTGTPAHAVKTILVEVHRVANFNLAGGAVVLKVPTKTYSLVPGSTTATPVTAGATTGPYNGVCGNAPPATIPGSASATAAPAYSCLVLTQRSNYQVSAMAGIVYYPWRHDYFPRRRGFSNYPQNYLPSLLIATSVNTIGNALGAVNFEPITGIDLFAGIGAANATSLPTGVSTTAPLPSTYSYTANTTYHAGFATGIALDLGVIGQLFSKTSTQAASLP